MLTVDEIAEFMTKYLGRHDQHFKDINFSKKFYEVFRHGLVHQWSPKFAGVGMSFGNKEILYDIGGGLLALNVPPFFDLVCMALKDFESDLDGNEELQEKFYVRLNAITTQDSKELIQLRELWSGHAQLT